jgi:hypothetical protein
MTSPSGLDGRYHSPLRVNRQPAAQEGRHRIGSSPLQASFTMSRSIRSCMDQSGFGSDAGGSRKSARRRAPSRLLSATACSSRVEVGGPNRTLKSFGSARPSLASRASSKRLAGERNLEGARLGDHRSACRRRTVLAFFETPAQARERPPPAASSAPSSRAQLDAQEDCSGSRLLLRARPVLRGRHSVRSSRSGAARDLDREVGRRSESRPCRGSSRCGCR